MATRQDIRNEGFRRGQAVASEIAMPPIGGIDWAGHQVTADYQFYAWEEACYGAEYRQRQLPSFAPTDRQLDELANLKPYDPWEVFEDGIRAGIRAYGRRHHKQALASAKQEG
jgi:hypothetical protein